jgi:Protein of unknown function (DUF3237)
MSKMILTARLRLRIGRAIHALIMTTVVFTATGAELTTPPAENPTLEHVLTVRATIDAPLAMGKTPQGQRRVIPITSGTFEGRAMKGTILPGEKTGSWYAKTASRNSTHAIGCVKRMGRSSVSTTRC